MAHFAKILEPCNFNTNESYHDIYNESARHQFDTRDLMCEGNMDTLKWNAELTRLLHFKMRSVCMQFRFMWTRSALGRIIVFE